MSYHVKDLIAELATVEKAELMIDSLDLLNAINYEGHTEKLEDILMTVDDYPIAETLTLIESTLLSSIMDCCNLYGLYIDAENINNLTLGKTYKVTEGLFNLVVDTNKDFDDLDSEEDSNKGKMISFLESATDLDFYELNEIIDYVDDELISALENNEKLLETKEFNKVYSINRLKKSKILEKAVNSRSLIMASGFGYDFYEVLSLFKKELLNIRDLTQRSIDFIAILFGSEVDNKDIQYYFNETVDYVAADEEEIIRLKPLATKVLKEYLAYV